MDITKLTGHTPGPLRAYVTRRGVPSVADSKGHCICRTNSRPIGKSATFTLNHETALANARLHAAATDLLELAKLGLALAEVVCEYEISNLDKIETLARALREKGRGE